MNMQILMYQQFIEENMTYSKNLLEEMRYWRKIYQKRLFDGSWPESIKGVMEAFYSDIEQQMKECRYYIKRLVEARREAKKFDLSDKAQPEKDPTDVGGESGTA